MLQSLRTPMLFDGWLIDWLIECKDMLQSLRIPFLFQSLHTLEIDTSQKEIDQTRPTSACLWV